eukprot:gene10466-12227_t
MFKAAQGGQVECIKYLHENGCPWDTDAITEAASRGFLDCVTYLHTNGCPWNTYTMKEASYNSHMKCVEYLYVNGCPWDATALSLVQAAAGEKGSMSCLKYLIEERGVDVQLDAEVFGAAFVKGNLASVQYLLEMGCELEPSARLPLCLAYLNARLQSS